jgi:preprotein translocase subunit Sec63
MLAMLYLLVAFLLIVWLVVKLLLRLVKYDTIRHDMRYLWEPYNITLKDIRFSKLKR